MIGYFHFCAVCNGNVTLSSENHPYQTTVQAAKLMARGITKRRIRIRHPETRQRITFEKVTFSGTCSWNVRDQEIGGRKFEMPSVGTHDVGWNIRAVELCDDD